MSEICVKLSSLYRITIKSGALDRLGKEIKEVSRAENILVVTDTNVGKLYLGKVEKCLFAEGYCVKTFMFEAGEQSKTADTYFKIIAALGEHSFKRTDAVVALGGGVVGDIAGFAAATYMRGIDVIQVPTTLLAMIDSSIGGKTGVDLPYGKNLLGAFHQPKAVIADTGLLSTLPQKEWVNGMGEGIKYACLAGGRIADIMMDGLDADNIDEFVTLCAAYKADIVCKDEKEGGLRKLLNLGHTVGHAIERNSGYKIPHGIAVAQGIAVMAAAAKNCGELSLCDYNSLAVMLDKLAIKNEFAVDSDIIRSVAMDKKAEGGNMISVVKIRSLGDCYVDKIPLGEFESFIRTR